MVVPTLSSLKDLVLWTLICALSISRIVRLGGRRVELVVAGAWHTIVKTDTGECYVMGCILPSGEQQSLRWRRRNRLLVSRRRTRYARVMHTFLGKMTWGHIQRGSRARLSSNRSHFLACFVVSSSTLHSYERYVFDARE